jgi:hypothetical protein
MAFMKCSVDGCNRKLQPVLKPDPRDRETWLYRECDVCLRPACEKHSTEVGGQVICDRCRREREARQQPALIDLGIRLPPQPVARDVASPNPDQRLLKPQSRRK